MSHWHLSIQLINNGSSFNHYHSDCINNLYHTNVGLFNSQWINPIKINHEKGTAFSHFHHTTSLVCHWCSTTCILLTVVYCSIHESCDCSILYYQWLFGQVLHQGIYPLNILLWTINYLVVLKFSASFVTYRRVITGLLTIWVIPVIITFPTIFVTTISDYVDCCETVCRNGSALCNTSLRQIFTPRLFNLAGVSYYQTRNVLYQLHLLLLPPWDHTTFIKNQLSNRQQVLNLE